MSELLDETQLAAGAGAGTAGADPTPDPFAVPADTADAAADPTAGDAAAADAQPEPIDPGFADEWTPPSREDWEGAQQLLHMLLSRDGDTAPQAQPADGEPAGFEWDPLADDAGDQLIGLLAQRDQFLLEQFGQMLGQTVSPLLSDRESSQVSEGLQRIDDIIADHQARDGEFIDAGSADLAKSLAESYWPEAVNRFGEQRPDGSVAPTRRASEAALNRAVKTVRAWEKRVADAALNRTRNELATLSGAPRDTGVGGVGVTRIAEGGDELGLVNKFLS